MGASAQLIDLTDRLPQDEEAESARRLLEFLEPLGRRPQSAAVSIEAAGVQARFDLPPALTRMLIFMLRKLSSGSAVTFVPVGGRLSTQQAADVLNVSRPFIVKLIDKGELPAVKVGRHRRLEASHVLAYKRRMEAAREAALARLAEDDAPHL